jgi:hypothetical protein
MRLEIRRGEEEGDEGSRENCRRGEEAEYVELEGRYEVLWRVFECPASTS